MAPRRTGLACRSACRMVDDEDPDSALSDEEDEAAEGRCNTGLRRRVYENLLEDERPISVHDNEEIRKMLSGVHRVDVKLQFYRTRGDLSCALISSIEHDFMSQEPASRSAVVNIAKVRSGARSSQGMRSQVSTRARVMTPEVTAVRTLERHEKHSLRVQRALPRARAAEMRQRMERRHALETRQARQALATQARPWVVAAVAALAVLAMRKIHATYLEALDAVEDEEEMQGGAEELSLAVRRTGTGASKEPAARILHSRHVEQVHRMVLRARSDDAEVRKKSRIWGTWTHLVRLATFLTRVLRPYRRHLAMERCKHFIRVTWKGFRLRKAVKGFVTKVNTVQHSMRATCQILAIVRRRILEPHVWAAETMILGAAVGVHEDVLRAEVAAHLERSDFQRWEAEVRRLAGIRDAALRGRAPPLLLLPQTAEGAALPQELAGGASRSSVMGKLRQRPERSTIRPGGRTSTQAPGSGPVDTPKGPGHRKLSALHHGPEALAGEAESRRRRSWNLAAAFSTVDKYRLPGADREELMRRLLRERVETWWRGWKLYKEATPESRLNWTTWRTRLSDWGGCDQELWPEPPPVLQYPEELLRPNMGTIRLQVLQYLKQRASEGHLPGLSL